MPDAPCPGHDLRFAKGGSHKFIEAQCTCERWSYSIPRDSKKPDEAIKEFIREQFAVHAKNHRVPNRKRRT